MGKKGNKYISLSEVDHKMQFINIIAVIGEITPTIKRSKLNCVELKLLDDSVEKPGFTVKLNMSSKVLNQFLIVSKTGFIICLRDIKVVKNEGEVYGNVVEEEELTLYSDNMCIQKWYPDETVATLSGPVKLKIENLVKWKKSNFKEIEMLPEDPEDKTKARRCLFDISGTVKSPLEGFNAADLFASKHSSSASKQNDKTRRNDFHTPKEDQNQEKTRGGSTRNKFEISPSKTQISNEKNNSSTSSGERESRRISPSRASFSKSPSRTRSVNTSKLNKSVSLGSLNKQSVTRSRKLSSPFTVNKSGHLSKAASLSKLNRSITKNCMNNLVSSSEKSKFTRSSIKTKEENHVSELKLKRFNSLGTSSLIKKTPSTSNLAVGDFSSIHHNPKRHSKHNKENDGKTEDTDLTKTRSCLAKKNKDVSIINSSRSSLRCTSEESDVVTVNSARKDKSKIKEESRCPELGSERETLNLRSSSADSTASRIKSENSVNRESRQENRNISNTRNTSESVNKQFRNRTSTPENACNRDTKSPTTKKRCLPKTLELLSDTSSDDSPKPKRKQGSIVKLPQLNSSDSTISDSLRDSNSSIGSNITKEMFSTMKRKYINNENSTECISKKKLRSSKDNIGLKNNLPTTSPQTKKNSDNCGNKKKINQKSEETKTDSDMESNKKEFKHISDKKLSGKYDESVPGFDATQNKNEKNEKNKALNKTLENVNKDIKSARTRAEATVSVPDLKLRSKQSGTKENTTTKVLKSNKGLEKGTIFDTYLRPLTKKLNLISVENLTDISLYDLEDVDVPEKIDIHCKVISQFLLIEDGIQVIRVQDGTLCKCSSLQIPEASSWDAVVKEILKNPTVEEKSPFIDIIIFNYFRLDARVVPGKFYCFHNIMAVKFQLLEDPRQRKKRNVELFFCVEGQHTNNKKLSGDHLKKIKERLESVTYKSSWSKIIGAEAEKPDTVSDSCKTPASKKNIDKHNSSLDVNPVKNIKEVCSLGKSKRKFNDSDYELEGTTHIDCTLREEELKTKIINKNSESASTSKKIKNDEAQFKLNDTISSDETMLGETPPLLREISDILHEESAMGLPQTISEDIHLKNSGSEVTFSQFCKEAKLKAKTFRTSTQNVESEDCESIGSIKSSVLLCEDITVIKENENPATEDTSKMEPLVYCPSGSSVTSSAVDGSPFKERSVDAQESEPCSVSILLDTKVKTLSDVKTGETESQTFNNDNLSDLSNSSSVKVISSNSSIEIDLEFVRSINPSNEKNINIECKKITGEITEVQKGESCGLSPQILDSTTGNAKQKSISPSKTQNEKTNQAIANGSEGYSLDHNTIKEPTDDQIEVVSDLSSNVSLFTIENNNTKVKPTTSVGTSANNNCDLDVDNLEEVARKIPDRCFYKSAVKPPSLTEDELNAIYDDENSPVKYFSYCHKRDLPMLTLDVIDKIRNTNSLSMTVTFTSMDPAFTGDNSWAGNSIKARCLSCGKLYNVYNTATSSSLAAITVGSHVVCPDSQCCNRVLEKEEFHFSIEMRLEDTTPVTALLAGTHAEHIFGCTAQEVIRDESVLDRVSGIFEKIAKAIGDKQPTKVVLTREDICNPKSGPIYLKDIVF